MGFKYEEMELEKQIALPFIAMAACVLILTVLTIWFSNSGVKPKEKAVLASVDIKNYVCLLPDGTINPRIIISSSDQKININEFRELEATVKNLVLREYTDSIIWDAVFTYRLDDGTIQERKYRKSGQDKMVDAFLQKHYKKMEETTDNYYYSEFLERQ